MAVSSPVPISNLSESSNFSVALITLHIFFIESGLGHLWLSEISDPVKVHFSGEIPQTCKSFQADAFD